MYVVAAVASRSCTVRSRKNGRRWVFQLGFSSVGGRAGEAVVRWASAYINHLFPDRMLQLLLQVVCLLHAYCRLKHIVIVLLFLS